jgi:5-methylcytosine-specific restriction enzyme A
MIFSDVVPSFTDLMGFKVGYGPRDGPAAVMCFNSTGADPNGPAYYSLAKRAAEQGLKTPYALTIGGGKTVRKEYKGRVFELVRVTGTYGKTEVFVKDEKGRERYSKWPTAVLLADVYKVEGEPLLIDDLGFPDRKILDGAFSKVVNDISKNEKLWTQLKDYKVTRRDNFLPPAKFKDSGQLELCNADYPKFSVSEGEIRYKECLIRERNSAAAKEAKNYNFKSYGGKYKCEGCNYSDKTRGLFDAHHLEPLAIGPRTSRLESYAVLCALCHRIAHFKSEDKTVPLTICELNKFVTSH